MNFSAQEIKKYEETTTLIQAELVKQGIPKPIFERVIKLIDEFEGENANLINKNHIAFLVVLLAKAYNEGILYGINENKVVKAATLTTLQNKKSPCSATNTT